MSSRVAADLLTARGSACTTCAACLLSRSMPRRAELLALVDGAPGALRSLQGAVATWTHRQRVDAVQARVANPDGRRHLVMPANGSDGEPREVWSNAYVVVEPPDRWRIVERGHVEASDGKLSWVGTGSMVTERTANPAAIRDAGAIGVCLYPGQLLGGLTFGEPTEDQIAGRPCWSVEGRSRAGRHVGDPVMRAVPSGPRLHEFIGLEHHFWIDATIGIVLRHEGSIDGEPCSRVELTDLVVDRPVSPREFGPPPGAIIRSRHELLRDHLASIGVDPDMIDLDDPIEVRHALRHGLSARGSAVIGRSSGPDHPALN